MSEDAPELASSLAFVADPLGALKRRWKIALPVFVVALAGLLTGVQSLITEEFLAEARVLVSTPRFSEEFVPSLEAGNPFEKIDAMVGELLTRDRLQELVEAHELYPDQQNTMPLAEMLVMMRQNVSVLVDPGSAVPTGPRRPGDLSARVFAVAFSYPDPEKAAAVANEVAAEFVSAAISLQTEQARIAAAFLRTELHKVESALDEQNQKITALKVASRGELPEELEATLGRLDRLQGQRQSLALQVVQTETNLVTLSGAAAGPDAIPTPQIQLDVLRARLAEQRAVFTEDHPNVISLQRQVALLEREIASGAALPDSKRVLVEGAQRTVAELQSQLRATEEEIARLENRVARTPEVAQELIAMEYQRDTLRSKHDELLSKVNDAELALSVETGQQGRRITVLEPAFPPESPLRSRVRFQAVAVLASIALPLGLVVLLELVDPVVISGRQLEQRYGVAIIGSAPPIV